VFTFIESAAFARVLPVYLDDDEYAELQQFLMEHPEAGDMIPGSGGVRKLRWNRKGMGKRGGLRVIYFVRYQPNEFWLLTLYAKAKQENVPAHLLKQLKEAFEHGEETHRACTRVGGATFYTASRRARSPLIISLGWAPFRIWRSIRTRRRSSTRP